MIPFVTVKELLRSNVAEERGIDNSIREDKVFDNLLDISLRLSFLRLVLDGPIYVNSGYRCERLNQAVNGSPKSLHMKGLAADIRTDPERIGRLIELLSHDRMKRAIHVREVIVHDTYVHVGFYSRDEMNKE